MLTVCKQQAGTSPSVRHHLSDLLEGEVCPEVVDVVEAGRTGGVRHGGGVVAELPLPHVDLVDGETDGDVGVKNLQFGDLTPKSDDLLPPVLSFLQGEPVLTDAIVKTITYFDLLLSLQFDLS